MKHPTLNEIETLLLQTASLLIYQDVIAAAPAHAYLELLQGLQAEAQTQQPGMELLKAYGAWFRAMATQQQSWPDYLLTRSLEAQNPFTQQIQRQELSDLSPALVAAARHDLRILQRLYNCDGDRIVAWFAELAPHLPPPISWNPISQPKLADLRAQLQRFDDWSQALEVWVAYYRSQGIGAFAQFRALRWQQGQLVGIAHPDPIRLAHLAGYEAQKAALVKNTEFLLNGYPALHVLLYGSRGSGKSSLVKALLNEFGDRGLRLVEVPKAELAALPTIMEQIHDSRLKFIIFVDDLSFEADDDAYKVLKVVLEGGVTARPANGVVYATSNRRHLIREFFDDRPRPQDADEIHTWDTVQEKLSFSDRFGLSLTFEPANQLTYLEIVQHLATQAGITLAQDDLEFRARQWATRHNGRSGRSARQFVDFLQAELALSARS
jgi:predicted AAA+ superfamily ATPase